jgi:hypothetical protein
MSKPGEMVQLLRDDYEQILEEYRLLRNKFLIAVPGMNLDRERDLHRLWVSDLYLSSIIDAERATPEATSAGPWPCKRCGGTGTIMCPPKSKEDKP